MQMAALLHPIPIIKLLKLADDGHTSVSSKESET